MAPVVSLDSTGVFIAHAEYIHIMYGLKLTTPPATEPVSVATMKAVLRLNTTAEDDLITGYIQAAREMFELMTDRSCITTVWTLYLDAFPKVIRLPRAPLQSVASVQYYDPNDNLITWDTTKYAVDTAREPGRIVPKVWFPDWLVFPVFPPLSYKLSPKIIVQFTAGWTAGTIPALVKQAIQLQAAKYFEERSSGAALEDGFLRVVNQFKLNWITNMNQPMYGNYGYAVE